MKTEIINARIEPHLKHSAERIFSALGMTTTDAISIFLGQVVLHRGLPFPVKIPNKATRKAIAELKAGKGTRYDSVRAMMDDLGR